MVDDSTSIAVSNILMTPGWDAISKWIQNEIKLHTNRMLDIDVGDVEVKERSGKIKVNIVVISKDESKNTIKAYQKLLNQIERWRRGEC